MMNRRDALHSLGLGAAALAALPLFATLTGCGSDGAGPVSGVAASGTDGLAPGGAGAPSLSTDFDAPDLTAAGDAAGAVSGGKTSAGADGAGTALESLPVSMGTLATEDFLPGWVARQEGLFEAAGLEVSITAFQSAQELSAALAAGSVDMAMTDCMVSAALTAGGTPVRLEWISLGTTPAQGRFGIATAADSGISSLADLRGRSIAVGSNTVPEYVMDKLLESAGLSTGDVTLEEVKKVPVRFQLMQAGQVDAAALPGSLLALGEATGCITVADDSRGDNLSQSFIIARTAFAQQDGGAVTLAAVQRVWNAAAGKINGNPESYRQLLVEQANLSEAVAASYPIPEYPLDGHASSDMVQPVLDWMDAKGYLTRPVTFDAATGELSAGN